MRFLFISDHGSKIVESDSWWDLIEISDLDKDRILSVSILPEEDDTDEID